MGKRNLIAIFLAVLDTQWLAGAARKHQRSRPVVSDAMGKLKVHLDVRSLTRTTCVVGLWPVEC